MIKIEQQDNGKSGRFLLYEGDEFAGEITYLLEEGTLVILHTMVENKFAGRGLGKQLVTGAAGIAKKNNLKILLFCPYAKKYLARSGSENRGDQ